MKNKYIVYSININGFDIYIGMTNNILRREYEHNYKLKKGINNELYNYLRCLNINDIKLKKIKTFENRLDAKRYECFLILKNYFESEFKLKQKIPIIKDICN